MIRIKEQRTISFEYEYTYQGALKCTNCGEEMKLLIIAYEYPKEFINYIDKRNEACLFMDDITNDSFNVI